MVHFCQTSVAERPATTRRLKAAFGCIIRSLRRHWQVLRCHAWRKGIEPRIRFFDELAVFVGVRQRQSDPDRCAASKLAADHSTIGLRPCFAKSGAPTLGRITFPNA